jgi:hypothetical protein
LKFKLYELSVVIQIDTFFACDASDSWKPAGWTMRWPEREKSRVVLPGEGAREARDKVTTGHRPVRVERGVGRSDLRVAK